MSFITLLPPIKNQNYAQGLLRALDTRACRLKRSQHSFHWRGQFVSPLADTTCCSISRSNQNGNGPLDSQLLIIIDFDLLLAPRRGVGNVELQRKHTSYDYPGGAQGVDTRWQNVSVLFGCRFRLQVHLQSQAALMLCNPALTRDCP